MPPVLFPALHKGEWEEERGSKEWQHGLEFQWEHQIRGYHYKKIPPQLEISKNFFYAVGETLEQVAQRSCECSITGNVEGHIG